MSIDNPNTPEKVDAPTGEELSKILDKAIFGEIIIRRNRTTAVFARIESVRDLRHTRNSIN